jgi:Ca-activated chloride channel family protein
MILWAGFKKKNKVLEMLSFKKKKAIYIIFILMAYIIAIFSLTGPRKLSDVEKIEVKGADIYILIDTSKSMLVEDILPNRLEKAKYEIREIVEGLKGDRISFIPFTDGAYVQLPLTDDYDMALMYLDTIDTDLINTGGTDFSNAISVAEKSFDKDSGSSKIILVISDGENHENLKINKELNIYAIGVGTKKGGVIPLGNGFVKDEKGNVVISRLESNILKEISKNGNYYESNNTESAYNKFLEQIEKIKRNSNREEELRIYKEFYQYFLFISFLIILVVYYWEERK